MTADTAPTMILTGPAEDAKTLKWLQLAASSDNTRPSLTGVYVDGPVTVSTDGFRLHVAPTPETLQDHQGEIISPTGGKWPSASGKAPFVATAEAVDANFPRYQNIVEDAHNTPVAAVVYLDAAFLTDFCNGLKKGTVVKITVPPNKTPGRYVYQDPVILATVPHKDAPATPERWAIVMPKNMHPDTDPGYDPFPRTEESEDSASWLAPSWRW